MAINGVVHSPNACRLGIAEEATFGTAIAQDAAFIEWIEWDSVSVDYGLTQEVPLRHRTRRLVDSADTYVSQSGGTRTITVSGLVVRRKDLQYLLYGVCQEVQSESATTPYQKVYGIDWTAQPDFSASAGLFFTLALRSQVDAYHETFTSCVIKSVKLSYDGVGGDGRIKADIEFISGFTAVTTHTYSGTWTIPTQVYVDGHNFATKSINSADAVIYGWDLNINNNAVRVGNDTTGQCQTYSIGVGGNGMETTLNIKTKYDANMVGLKAKYLAGTFVPAILTLGSSGVAGYFHIGYLSSIVTGMPFEDAEQGQAINLSLTGTYKTGALITFAEAAADADRTWA